MRYTTFFTTAAILACVLLTAGSALAGPPLATDDTGTVDIGKVEIELSGSHTHDKKNTHGVISKSSGSNAELKITTGLYKNLGISLAIPYTINERVKKDGQSAGKTDGSGDMILELKYAFAELAGVSFAIKPAIIMPTGKFSAGLSESRWQSGTTLIATKEFEDGKYAMHVNLCYEYHSYRSDLVRDSARSDLWSGSIAGEAKLMKDLTAMVDFWQATTTDRSTSELSAYALSGARYEINDHLHINAGIKLGLSGPEHDVSILSGLTMKF